MINRTTKLRWRRRYRRSKQQVGGFGQQAEDHLDKHIFRRLSKLGNIRRFIVSWLLLIVLLFGITVIQTYGLSAYYQRLSPVPGGTFTEGVVGTYTNADPLFATTEADTTVSSLIFAGLFKYNQSNQLVGNLAQSYTSDARGLNYTVYLRKHLYWQDHVPLTAADVVYTFQTIQNPDVQSPLFSSWRGVSVKALNSTTVLFSLPDPLSSFPYSLTTGIIPEHLLSSIAPADLRSATFNTIDPVGAGPFKWGAINVLGTSAATQEVIIGLDANKLYYSGPPKLDRFVVHTFNDSNQMLLSFEANDIDSMVGLDSLPNNLQNNNSITSYNVPLTAEVMVFFNTSQGILADPKVRQALVQSIDENQVVSQLGYPVLLAKSPLLPFQIGYDPSILQIPTDTSRAAAELTADGWVVGKNGFRYKNGQQLQFTLVTQDTTDYANVSQDLSNQWRVLGVNAQVVSQQPTDFQGSLQDKAYDAVLYGITIGVDPDVFVYWDSSQAAPNAIPGLNLSLYKSTTADEALEGGRTRVDPQLRAVKYKPFLQAWETDAPALALYQPRFLYVTHNPIYGLNPTMFNTATDRFSNVSNWEVREVYTTD